MYSIIKQLIQWTGKYKKRLYTGFVFAFITGIFMTIPIGIAGYSLQIVIADIQGSRQLQSNDIILVLIGLIAAVVGRFVFSYLRAVKQETVMYERLADVRIEFGSLLKKVNLGFFSNNNIGDLVSAVTTDMSFLELHAMSMLDQCVNGLITMVVMILFLCYFSLPIALIAVAGAAFSFFFLHQLSKASQRNEIVHHESQTEMVRSCLEYLRGIAVVKTFNQKGSAVKNIHQAFDSSRNINIKIEKEYAVFNFFHMFSLKIAQIGIVALAGYQTYNGSMRLSDMIMLDILSFVIFQSAENFSSAFHVLEVIHHTLDKLDFLLKTPSMETLNTDEEDIDINNVRKDIELKNISFGYEDNQIIKNVSCSMTQGSFNAVVGPSGSGKTTLTKLIARFYDLNEGKIFIGGRDIREYPIDKLMSMISIVFQKVYLFEDSIAANISFGRPDASREEIIEAAKKACCHDFIMSLPNGYDTVINEAGSSLSGGERQRISIARAILKDASIVILDEATSSVDPENEHLIQAALQELTKNKTVISIAHRLETIKNADQIIVLDDGQIVQRGTHNELVIEDGIYKDFVHVREKAENWKLQGA